MKSWIVISWISVETRWDSQEYKATTTRKVEALVWLRRGTEADAKKAQAYAESDSLCEYQVHQYPTTEKEPLQRARKERHA